MSEPISVIDRSFIREGKLDEVRSAAQELARFVEENEPRPIAYNFHVDREGRTMTVVQVHPDSESMEEHLRVAASVFARFEGLLELRSMDVFGAPSGPLLEQLRSKIDLLGTATIEVHERIAGFARGSDSRPAP